MKYIHLRWVNESATVGWPERLADCNEVQFINEIRMSHGFVKVGGKYYNAKYLDTWQAREMEDGA